MRIKGNILLILLVMLIFSSAALLQLNEDNYLTHLIAQHVDDLSVARQALSESFEKVLSSSEKNQACFAIENDKNALDVFWKTHSCQMNNSGIIVDYAFQLFEQDKQEPSYFQYTLRVKTSLTSVWLRVVTAQESNLIVSWTYYL